MARTHMFMVFSAVALLVTTPAAAQTASPPSLSPSPSPSPAPAPAPHLVNLTALLSFAGPFHTFLNYLVQTQVIQTFQDQANNTDQGITIFAPTDDAFSSLKKPPLTNLTQEQLKSLLLFHALPKYYSLAEFGSLSLRNPVSTFAGGQYTLNFSDASGLVRADSSWSNPKIASSVISTSPVAVYSIQRVLLPVAIFGEAPPPAPAPAPAPDATKPSDLSPSENSEAAGSPRSSESSTSAAPIKMELDMARNLVLAIAGGLMMLL